MRNLFPFLCCLLANGCIAEDSKPENTNLNKFLNALHQVETGGRTGAIKGDNGRALGPLQIHIGYWRDAIFFDKSIGGKYEDCQDLNYSKKITSAYFQRYASQELANQDWQSLARLHNSGPNWKKKIHLTNHYWQKVKQKM